MEPLSYGLREKNAEIAEEYYFQERESYKDEILKRLGSVSEKQIDLIATRIVNRLLPNLGAIGTAKAIYKVKQKKPKYIAISPEIDQRIANDAITSLQTGRKFISGRNQALFVSALHKLFETVISATFSHKGRAAIFFYEGIDRRLSGPQSEGFLKNVAQKIGITLTQTDVPPDFRVHLEWDFDKTTESDDVVFSLTQECSDVELSKETFTIADLEKPELKAFYVYK